MSERNLTLRILTYVVPGGVLVALVWSAVNDLLAGTIRWPGIALAIPALIALVFLLRRLAAAIGEMDNPNPSER